MTLFSYHSILITFENIITILSNLILFFVNSAQFFPRSLAPNVMTFVGFLLTALNVILLSYYDWDFYASTDDENYPQIPNWIWLFAAINLFLAYTLGNYRTITKTNCE
jgi:hypothetical protein